MSDQNTADRIACQDVMLKYASGVDDRDMVRYRSCFADDVEVLGFGELSAYEKGWFDKMLPELKAQIQKGIDFANNK